MEDNNSNIHPLLDDEDDQQSDQDIVSSYGSKYWIHLLSNHSFLSNGHSFLSNGHSFLSSFVVGADDIPPVTGVSGFVSAFKNESSKLWYLAGPAILTCIFQYSLGAITQTFAGHVGTLELAAFSIQNSIIGGLSLGIMMGMGSALETLCGQAYGAGEIEMLGVYMQRSWVILLSTSFLLMFMYIFAEPLLLLLGQSDDISRFSGRYAMWMIPQLYAYALNYPIAKFLQAQSKMMAMAWISGAALAFHSLFSWLLMMKFRWGIAGGAIVLNASWWFLVVAQMVYIFSGACGKAWTGFSLKAFENLWGFVKLSVASAVMMCLEVWYFTALILFAGYLKNAEVAVDALSICVNILGWMITVSVGFNAAISVRVSNELGAGHPRAAKFSVVVVVVSSFILALLIAITILIFQKQYPSIFSESAQVQKIVYQLTPLLAFCIVLNNVQPTLSGVAIGAGWQALVAYVNIACYYLLGVPLGIILGNVLNMGVQGIWCGMVVGTIVQTLVLFWIVYKTNWNKERKG
ncbi:Protein DETOXIFICATION 31 [Castilleja foliolosa]|uniref:Protein DETOXIFICATION n=1 Tax=Castilleja foliolosa TaxID=1961234 RepID=A0ABD3E6V2_9LAMI